VTEEMPDGGSPGAPRRRGTLLGTLRTVAWSFFGVRNSSGHEQDVEGVNPLYLVIAALVAAALFVLVLIGLARWAVSSGVAG
jgi:hypothetical protein